MQNGSPRSIRVTFRGQLTALVKLFAIARQNEMTNAAGAPNISAAVTHLIDKYDEDKIDKKFRDLAHQDAVEYLSAKGNGKR
jgi:hypothetical protein